MSATTREERLKQYRKERETAFELILLSRKDDALALLESVRQQANSDGDEDYRMLFESLQIQLVQPDHPQQIELLQQALQWETEQGYSPELVMYLEIGRFYAEAGDQDTAISCFSEALNLDQGDPETLRLTGISIAKQGDPDTALKWIEAALAASENNDSFSWREKAFLEQPMEKLDEALESIEQAAKLRPDLWTADREKLEKLCKKETPPPFSPPQPPPLPPMPPIPKVSPELMSELAGDLNIEPKPEESPAIDDDTPIGGSDGEMEIAPKQEPTDSPSALTLEKTVVEAVRSGCVEFRKRFLAESVLPKEKALWFFLKPHRTDWTCGGGHFLWNRGTGTLIDPGFGFLDSLAEIGGSLAEVRNVLITHDNESQLAEFEIIRKLMLRGNLAGNVRFFLNLGAIQKLSAMVDLNDKSFSEGYLTLYAGANYDLLGGGKIRTLPAYHQELKSADQAVGLQISLDANSSDNSDSAKRIVYTSDTGLFPLSLSYDSTESRIVHVSDKNQVNRVLSRRYKDEGAENADLMILHFGQAHIQFEKSRSVEDSGIKVDELEHIDPTDRPGETELAGLCAVGQLGFLGTREMVEQCKPKFAVVCQWARELGPLRTALCELLQKQIGTEPTRLVAGDSFLVYDIFADAVYDCVRDGWTAARDIIAADWQDKLFYFSREVRDRFESLPDYYANRFLNDLRYKQETYFR